MFSVEVRDSFVAQHFLVGGDWGRENHWHSHCYGVEVQLRGSALNRHQYLVDIETVKSHLGRVVDEFRDKTLNELPEFEQRNPSLELLAKVFAERFSILLGHADIDLVVVRLWEDDIASASFALGIDSYQSGAENGHQLRQGGTDHLRKDSLCQIG